MLHCFKRLSTANVPVVNCERFRRDVIEGISWVISKVASGMRISFVMPRKISLGGWGGDEGRGREVGGGRRGSFLLTCGNVSE